MARCSKRIHQTRLDVKLSLGDLQYRPYVTHVINRDSPESLSICEVGYVRAGDCRKSCNPTATRQTTFQHVATGLCDTCLPVEAILRSSGARQFSTREKGSIAGFRPKLPYMVGTL